MSKLKLTTIANITDTENTNVTNVINGSAKAWVNFNGNGTVAIRRAFNVSSITDNGTGDYTVNFTNAMVDVDYSFLGTCNYSITGNNNQILTAPYNQAPTTTAIRLCCSNGSNNDELYVYCAVFR